MGCYIWYSEEGPGQVAAPPSFLLAVPNVTAHPSTASVPVTVLLYNGPLMSGFNVPVKGITGDYTIFAAGCYASVAYAVMWCLSVCPITTVETNKHMFKFFSPSGSHTILVFPYQRHGNIPTGTS